ncbi:hypothetical protein HD841_000979 [Sphingomonas melonis]|uniref:Uncharacterized protein n=1 Tax=Sphingomonas melonis TaxID=152682 RepID=A0A7Y9K2A8_9SPHN|nr:hypothetical protein [Sphingomonas melonis]
MSDIVANDPERVAATSNRPSDTRGAYLDRSAGGLNRLRLRDGGLNHHRLLRHRGIVHRPPDIDEWRPRRRLGVTTEYPRCLV